MKKRIVVDASVMAKWLIIQEENHTTQANILLKEIQEGKTELYAPELSKYEIGNFLLKQNLAPQNASIALDAYYKLPIKFIPETEQSAIITYQRAHKYKMTGNMSGVDKGDKTF